MRLRVKTSGGRLERITIPDSYTLGDLQNHVAGLLLLASSDVKLSLNKKVLRRNCVLVLFCTSSSWFCVF